MARGWESKDIQSQQEMAEERRNKPAARTPEQIARDSARNSLLLDRTRVERDLANARHPRHRQQLADALSHIDQRLAELGPDPLS